MVATSLVRLPLLAALLAVPGCTPVSVDDPYAELSRSDGLPVRQRAAMDELDATSPDDAEYHAALYRILWRDGYTQGVRESAFARLQVLDPEGLTRSIEANLPRTTIWGWHRRLCEIIAEEGWTELTPTLVGSWGVYRPQFDSELERPEAFAIASLHGDEEVVDVVFDTFVETRRVAQQGLRTRAWELLHRLGERERLIRLLAEVQPAEDDLMLVDLHVGAAELGIVPHNREEILWLRRLRQPEYASFWSEVRSAIEAMPARRRAEVELRDLAVIAAAGRHDPDLLAATEGELLEGLHSRLRDRRRFIRLEGASGDTSSRSRDVRNYEDVLTWGDLAAMHLALRALEVPEVVAHVFDYAARDRTDTTTEYGGVLQLDQRGRFELLEFQPIIRQHDQKFIASQEMFDAAYTALFHFHLHAQKPNNSEYAGPGYGDRLYANATRANCLVFTSVDARRLNVDFYRHGDVVVDLGTIERR